MNHRILWLLTLGSALSLLAALPASAQMATPYPVVGQKWHETLGYVPNSPTAITTSDSLLGGVWLANTTADTVAITITDNSTNCGGATCQIWPAVSVGANSIVAFTFGGLLAGGGVKWSASASNSITGWIWGNYTASTIADVWKTDGLFAMLGILP